MAQPFEQSSKSLWGLEQVLKKQAAGRGEVVDDFDMKDAFDEIPDEALMEMDV